MVVEGGCRVAIFHFGRLAEERIREAQKNGAFENLVGKGKPLVFEDLSLVPADLRLAYHVLKNAHVVPPEVELRREIRSLKDLLVYIEDESERKAIAKHIEWKIIRLDLLKHRSFSLHTTRTFARKLVQRFLPRRNR